MATRGHKKDIGKGTYILVLYMGKGRFTQIGRLGRIRFKKGWYTYVGSAFGPGGLMARIKHHAMPKTTFHWHMDYLEADIREIWISGPGARLEHEWADFLNKTAADNIPGFGCSDCRCASHLFYFRTLAELQTPRKIFFKSGIERLKTSDGLPDVVLGTAAPVKLYRLS